MNHEKQQGEHGAHEEQVGKRQKRGNNGGKDNFFKGAEAQERRKKENLQRFAFDNYPSNKKTYKTFLKASTGKVAQFLFLVPLFIIFIIIMSCYHALGPVGVVGGKDALCDHAEVAQVRRQLELLPHPKVPSHIFKKQKTKKKQKKEGGGHVGIKKKEMMT